MKVLFVINNMTIGGTRSSLVNFITYLSNIHKEIEIDLFLLSKTGEYLSRIPSSVNILSGDRWTYCSFKSRKDLTTIEKIDRAFLCIAKKIFGHEKVLSVVFDKNIKSRIGKEYDIVVGFQEGLSNDFAGRMPAKKKVLWIHNNFENLDVLSRGFYSSYKKADAIVFVAEASKKSFEKQYPEFANKMKLIRNIILQDDIRKRANQPVKDVFYTKKKETIKLISVGRVVPQKAFDRVILAAQELVNRKIDFEWIVVGNGPDFVELNKKVAVSGLGQVLRFVGGKENPYPYMKQADLLVLSSIYEAQPMVIIEALTIGTPVMSTRFASASELLGEKEYGVIVDNTPEGVSEGVYKLCCNRNKIDLMKEKTQDFIYDNEVIVNEFLHL